MDESFLLPPRLREILEDLPLDQLAFAPVPVRARHDGWTPARQTAFIHRFALIGCVSQAARSLGMTKASAYRLRARPEAAGFAAAWDRALGWGRSRMIEIGMERALLGEAAPVTYRGRRIATRHRHDNRLLIALLNALGRFAPVKASHDDFDRAIAALERGFSLTEKAGFSSAR